MVGINNDKLVGELELAHIWHVGDCIEYMKTLEDKSFDFVIADPPYADAKLINAAIEGALRVTRGAVVVFMYPEDLCTLKIAPEQVCHWVKPVSTKNTKHKYSRFVEAIAVWHGKLFNQDLHWSARSGVFTDSIIAQGPHPFKKPDSLIEKLLLLHAPVGGSVLDLFGGSGTVKGVCERLGYSSVSCEIEPKWSLSHF